VDLSDLAHTYYAQAQFIVHLSLLVENYLNYMTASITLLIPSEISSTAVASSSGLMSLWMARFSQSAPRPDKSAASHGWLQASRLE
jgi:hypothetical protein